MSTVLWNEENLLERYQVFKYNYFIQLRPILLNYLRNLYKLYNIDLKSNFLSLSFYGENEELKMTNVTKKIEYIKTDLFEYWYFQKAISNLTQIVFKMSQNNSYKVPVFALEETRRHFEKEKIENYTRLFTEISNNIFQYFLNMKFSIATLDKVIRSIKIENSLDLHRLPCLVAAFFKLILYEKNKNQ